LFPDLTRRQILKPRLDPDLNAQKQSIKKYRCDLSLSSIHTLLNGAWPNNPTDNATDAFVQWTRFGEVNVRAGQFKMPFGLSS
jgi:hypothetical protein